MLPSHVSNILSLFNSRFISNAAAFSLKPSWNLIRGHIIQGHIVIYPTKYNNFQLIPSNPAFIPLPKMHLITPTWNQPNLRFRAQSFRLLSLPETCDTFQKLQGGPQSHPYFILAYYQFRGPHNPLRFDELLE